MNRWWLSLLLCPDKKDSYSQKSVVVLGRIAISLPSYKIVVVPADGIGSEVIDAVIDAISRSNE